MSRETGFGIVGAGLIAPFHLNALKECEGGKAVGVFDIRRERAEEVAGKFGAKAFDDLDKMLEEDEIDVICVATPNHLHRDIVIKSANAGKHILTEKPPAMTLAETDEMISVCEEKGLKFGCFVQCRIREAIQAIKKAIEDGRFGTLLRADTYMKWYRGPDYYSSDAWRASRKSGSGVTVAQGFHYIDLLAYLAGPAVEVDAKMTNLSHPDADLEDDVVATVNYDCGAKGIIQLSTAMWPGIDIRLEINGTEGIAVMTGETMTTWEFTEEQPEDEHIRRIGDAAQETGAGGPSSFGYQDHKTVLQDMIDSIKQEKEVVIPVKSVRHSLEIVLAMYQSAARGKPVTWPVEDDDSIWDAPLAD